MHYEGETNKSPTSAEMRTLPYLRRDVDSSAEMRPGLCVKAFCAANYSTPESKNLFL